MFAVRQSLRAAAAPALARGARVIPGAYNYVNIVEVGPRDGLQNEPTAVSTSVKAELINRLSDAGVSIIESGSFVSPKWVPQMAGTDEVLKRKMTVPDVRYPVLVPNMKGLDSVLALLEATKGSSHGSLTDEVSVFTATTDSFTKANTNCTVQESLVRLAPVIKKALHNGLRVRGYVSMIIDCPFEGKVDPAKVREVSEKLVEMGCYQVSLGDTTGSGTPLSWEKAIREVNKSVEMEMIAAHTHDTFGMAVANVMTAVRMGVRTVDSSVGGLGGCPYTPGATGNVSTEDVLYALHNSGYATNIDLNGIVETGYWISEQLGRPNVSRVGRAWRGRLAREAARDAGANL